MLENQLHVYTRNVSEDDVKKQLAKALEEKHNDTIVSKVSIVVYCFAFFKFLLFLLLLF